jgi:uncharacterized membrane protein
VLELFAQFGEIAAMSIEGAAVLIVTAGSLDAFVRVLGVAGPGAAHGARKAVWRRYGMWLLLALEFTLAADIIRTVVSPTWQEIGELAAIAVIRTFLNYFLERDLEDAADGAGVPGAVAARDLHAVV